MTNIYNEQDFINAEKQKKKVLITYFIILGIGILIELGLFIFYTTLPYQAQAIKVVKIIFYLVLGIEIIFSFIYLGIKYKLIKKYCRMLKGVQDGERVEYEGTFLRYSGKEVKANVLFNVLIFSEWNQYKKEFFERKVYVDAEKSLPLYEEGEKVKYITYANIMIEFEKEGEVKC